MVQKGLLMGSTGCGRRGPIRPPRSPAIHACGQTLRHSGSSFFTSLSGVTEMTTGFLVAVSFTVMVDAAAFTA